MAKIQVSTVEMRSKAQVIVLDASFVAKAVKARCKLAMFDEEEAPITEWEKQVVRDAFAFLTELEEALLGEEEKQELECQTKQGEE